MNTMQFTNFAWSLALAIGCWGLGNPIIKKIKEPGWAAAPLGMAIIVLIGGWLDLAGEANRTNMTIIALIAIGFALIQHQDAIIAIKSIRKSAAWVPVLSAALITWYGCQSNQLTLNWDDGTGYLPVCHELSAHGRSWAPFSLRRAICWGGQFPLQNLGMLFTADYGAYVYERGVATWMWAAVGVATIKAIGNWRGALLAIWLPVLPHTNVNSAPHATLAILLLTLWTLRQHPILFGGIAAALMALRFQAIPMVGLITIWTLWEQIRKNPNWKSNATAWALRAAIPGGILLIPFITNHIWQFKTPLPMLWHGTVAPEYIILQSDWKRHLNNFVNLTTQVTGILWVLAWMSSRKKTQGIALATLGTLIYFVYAMAEYSMAEWIRYVWPLLMATVATTFLQIPKNKWLSITSAIAVAPIALNSVTLLIMGQIDIKSPDLTHEVMELAATSNPPGETDPSPKKEAPVQINRRKLPEVQTEIPEGATIATILTQTNLLNFSRNKIANLDEMGVIGNLPQTANINDWKIWAKRNGIEFLLYNDFQAYLGTSSLEEQYTILRDPRANLLNYQRVWIPRRKIIIGALNQMKVNENPKTLHGFVIFDLR